MKALSAAQQLIQGLILAKLQQNINVFRILEEMLEPDNVIVMKTPVNLDLGHKLLLCAGLGEGCFSDDFSG